MSGDHDVASTHDFGTDISPPMVGRHRVVAYRFGGSRGRVMMAGATVIIVGSAKHSILFLNVRLEEGASVEDACCSRG